MRPRLPVIDPDVFRLELYVRIAHLVTFWARHARWPRIEGDGWFGRKLDKAGEGR